MYLLRKKSAQEWLKEEDTNLMEMISELNTFKYKINELSNALVILKNERKEKIGENIHARVLDIISSIEKLFGTTQEVKNKIEKIKEDETHLKKLYRIKIYYGYGTIIDKIIEERETITIGRDTKGLEEISDLMSRQHLILKCEQDIVFFSVTATNATLVTTEPIDRNMGYENFKNLSEVNKEGKHGIEKITGVFIYEPLKQKFRLAFTYKISTE